MMSLWDPRFLTTYPFQVFETLPLSLFASHQCWPEISEYNHLLKATGKTIVSANNNPISFVEQKNNTHFFDEQYEPRIFLKGEVLTRKQCWHDFFNMLVWLSFPLTKKIINSLQFHSMKERVANSQRRTSLENALTLFDENGIVIVSSDENLLDCIINFRWKELFWTHRANLQLKLQCIVLGHSLHEKFLNPYIGMTGHAILLKESERFFSLDLTNQLQEIDNRLASIIDAKKIFDPKMLHPFPVLGMPNWYAENNQEFFYENIHYFRTSRRTCSVNPLI